jgi:ectoine hydroxylase-related dioxygenase (phytanoyl-CoA dioxygenase family)
MSLPWIESPFFDQELTNKKIDPKLKSLASEYHQNGFVVVKNIFSEKELNSVIEDMDSMGFNKAFHTTNYRDQFRVQDFWNHSDNIKNLSCKKEILDILRVFFDREPLPFQTLNFKIGSRQAAHSDSIHFSSLPSRYMCGVWVALEDMTEENGTVFYCPGSQNLGEIDFTHIIDKPRRTTYEDYKIYEEFMEQMILEKGMKKVPFYAKKGDVLIWSSNIIHGGMPVLNDNLTRYSQVTHYYFKDTYCYVPMLSNMATKEYFLRNNLIDIKTGNRIQQSYNGEVLNQIQTEPGLFILNKKLKRLPKIFRALGYSGYYLK